jgi:hypothetical protein
MLSASKQRPKSARARKSLSDRLATVSALAGIKVRFVHFHMPYDKAQPPSRDLGRHPTLGDPRSSNHNLRLLGLVTLRHHPAQFLRYNFRCV